MTPAPTKQKTFSESKGPFANFISKFTVLRGAIRELWLTFAIKLLVVSAYAITNSTLVLWLSSDLGYSDQKALALVAAWSAVMTLITVLVGPLTDALGLRRTLFIGAWTCAAARLLMVVLNQPLPALALGLMPLAVGEALSTPVLVAAVRRYSNTRQRSISFSLFYLIMNLGFVVAAFVFDFVRQGLGERAGMTVPGLGTHLTTYRALFLVSLLLELGLLPLVFLLRAGVEATENGLRKRAEESAQPHLDFWHSTRLSLLESARATAKMFRTLIQQPGFYRLLAFLVLIAFLKLIFKQMDYVYPKFGIRELGEGAPIGRLWGINSILIIFLVPLVGALTQRFSAYRMVIFGGSLCALSVFIMALPAAWFSGLADGWMGKALGRGYLGLQGPVHPYYVMIFLFVALLSLGESFYSPRVYEYAAAIAPKGQEASYSALSYIPFLLPKLIVGTISGALLAKYCPAEGPRHPEMMWLVIALLTTVAPVGLLLFQRQLQVPEAGREKS